MVSEGLATEMIPQGEVQLQVKHHLDECGVMADDRLVSHMHRAYIRANKTAPTRGRMRGIGRVQRAKK